MKTLTNTIFYSVISGIVLLFSGCTEEKYYSMDDYNSYEKIDAHVHVNAPNPLMIDQGRRDNMRLITINTEGWNSLPITEQQQIAIELKSQYPGWLAYATTFSTEGWDDSETWQNNTINYLKESFDKGAVAAKVWKSIGLVLKDDDDEFVMIDDPQFDPVFEYLASAGKPLYGHIGEPKNTWLPLEEMSVAQDRNYFENNPQYHMYLHPEYPSYEQIIEARDNMLDKNPDLVFIGCHLGSMEWSVDMMAEHLDKYPNMIYDMAHRIPHIQHHTRQDREKVRNFFIEYQDRLIYSTDLQLYKDSDPDEVRTLAEDTWINDWEFFVTDNTIDNYQFEGSFQGLKLPIEVVDKLYRENVQKWIPGTGF
ncbi:MAG: amidohydrolase family protein [Balneolales bacterium]